MQKIKFFICFFTIFFMASTLTYSFSIHKTVTQPGQLEMFKTIPVSQLITISAKQLTGLTGIKMNIWERLSFEIIKNKMKRQLKRNPNRALQEYAALKPRKRLGAGWWILIGAAGALLLLVLIFVIAHGNQK